MANDPDRSAEEADRPTVTDEDQDRREKRKLVLAWQRMLHAGTMAPSAQQVAETERRRAAEGEAGVVERREEERREEERRAEEARRADEQRAREEARAREAQRQADELAREEQRRADEQRARERAVARERARAAEEARVREEERQAEDERQAEEERAHEEVQAAAAVAAGPATDWKSQPLPTTAAGSGGTEGRVRAPSVATGDSRRPMVVAASLAAVGLAVLALLAATGTFSADDSPEQSASPPAGQAQEEQPPAGEEPAGGGSDTGGVATWPEDVDGYTVVTYISRSSRRGAISNARRAEREGFQSGVIRSNQYESLPAGYWITFVGRYEDRAAAQRAARRAQRAGLANAPYVRFVDSGS